MPLIRLTRHQDIKVVSPTGFEALIKPFWGDRLIVEVERLDGGPSLQVTPTGYAKTPILLHDNDLQLECWVYLNRKDHRWICEMRGPRHFQINRVDKL